MRAQTFVGTQMGAFGQQPGVGGDAEAAAPEHGGYTALEPIAVNLAGGGYLKIGITLDYTMAALGGGHGLHANLSALKNNRGKAVRFSTLTALCDALGCSPGELFTVRGR